MIALNRYEGQDSGRLPAQASAAYALLLPLLEAHTHFPGVFLPPQKSNPARLQLQDRFLHGDSESSVPGYGSLASLIPQPPGVHLFGRDLDAPMVTSSVS